MNKHFCEYKEKGVDVLVNADSTIKMAKLKYTGDLAKDTKGDIYAHIGYVDMMSTDEDTEWHDIRDIRLVNTGRGTFEAAIPLDKEENKLSFAFKDDADKWDNNMGCDYNFNI